MYCKISVDRTDKETGLSDKRICPSRPTFLLKSQRYRHRGFRGQAEGFDGCAEGEGIKEASGRGRRAPDSN